LGLASCPVASTSLGALDYLLKPFTRARLQKALHRARAQLLARKPGSDPQIAALLATIKSRYPPGPHILVKSPNRIVFLKPEEIEYIEAAANYLLLHVGNERHIVRDTMAAMEAKLASTGFMRINRSTIVNLSRIRELEPLTAGEFSVILKSGARFHMTCNLGELQTRMGRL